MEPPPTVPFSAEAVNSVAVSGTVLKDPQVIDASCILLPQLSSLCFHDSHFACLLSPSHPPARLLWPHRSIT